MNNVEKLNEIFVEIFSCNVLNLNAEFNKDNIDGWDSVRQLTLTSAIEETFDIFMDPEDIIACSSYNSVMDVLKKYGIDL